MAYTLFNRQGEIEVEPNFVKSCQVFIDLFEEFETDDNTDPIPITESYNLDDVKLMTDYFSKINKFVIEYNSKEISYLDYITYHKDDYIINYTNNNKAPYQINRDYGSATITSTPSIAQNTFFKVASFVAARDAVVNGGILQVIASGTGNFTVAIVKHTPSTTAQLAYPVVLSEKIVAGLGNTNLVNSYPYNIPLDFANTAITAGDRVFIMLKGSEGGELGEVSVCATIEIGYIS